MVRITQHVPAFVETDRFQRAEAPTLDELLAVQWVADYARDVEALERRGTVSQWVNGELQSVEVIHTAPEAKRFHRWSRSDDCLMVEFNGGDWFWVVGRLACDDASELAGLPMWEETNTARARREAWNRGELRPQPAPYRCAEHGVAFASCCLQRPASLG